MFVNVEFKVTILDHFNSCLFGTFLGNTEVEREQLKVKQKTQSIWDLIFTYADHFAYVLSNTDSPSLTVYLMIRIRTIAHLISKFVFFLFDRYRNPQYSPEILILRPDLSRPKIRLWESYYLRWRALELMGYYPTLQPGALREYHLGIHQEFIQKTMSLNVLPKTVELPEVSSEGPQNNMTNSKSNNDNNKLTQQPKTTSNKPQEKMQKGHILNIRTHTDTKYNQYCISDNIIFFYVCRIRR